MTRKLLALLAGVVLTTTLALAGCSKAEEVPTEDIFLDDLLEFEMEEAEEVVEMDEEAEEVEMEEEASEEEVEAEEEVSEEEVSEEDAE